MSSEIHAPYTEPTEQTGGRRLDSWKEIAAFFQRDTRTVRRWEQTRRLPVRRVPGRRGYVFAYAEELNQWLRSADAKAAEEEAAEPDAAEPLELDEPELAAPGSSVPSSEFLGVQPTRSRWGFVFATAAILLVSIAAVVFARHRHHPTAAISASLVSPADQSESTKFTLRGKYYWDRRTEGGLQQALDAFTQAVVHDNNNARAYAGLAETYDLLPQYGSMSKSDAFPRAIAAANRAIALDPSLAEAHRALAFGLFYWDWDVNRALSEYRIALQLDPLDFETHHWLATTFLTLGRGTESVAEIQRARELRPASRSILADQALIDFNFRGDPAESIATLREIERTDPDFVTAPRYLSQIFHARRDYAGYIAESTRAAAITHDANVTAVMQEASIGLRQGGERGMLLRMEPLQERQFAAGQISGFDVAITCAQLGDKQGAVHYLQAAFTAHDYMLLTILNGDIDAQLKGLPTFTQLQAAVRQRMNQPT
jgi:tetratricopeptide (TPR) repeat protein